MQGGTTRSTLAMLPTSSRHAGGQHTPPAVLCPETGQHEGEEPALTLLKSSTPRSLQLMLCTPSLAESRRMLSFCTLMEPGHLLFPRLSVNAVSYYQNYAAKFPAFWKTAAPAYARDAEGCASSQAHLPECSLGLLKKEYWLARTLVRSGIDAPTHENCIPEYMSGYDQG